MPSRAITVSSSFLPVLFTAILVGHILDFCESSEDKAVHIYKQKRVLAFGQL